MEENHSFDNIAGYWSFHPDIGELGTEVFDSETNARILMVVSDNLRNLETPYCNDYTNPNWTVWGEPLKICAGPYEQEVPLTDPDHGESGWDRPLFDV
jgi:phospholipase C